MKFSLEGGYKTIVLNKMKLPLLLLLLVCYLPMYHNMQAHRQKIWKEKHNAWYLSRRLTYVMRTIHREGMARHKDLNTLRFMYEQSPHYEMGYIMGEIIERYRKMISHVRRRFEWENIFIHELIRRVQTVQYLYFEIYNLQRMMHEIELKYKTVFEFSNIHVDVDMGEVAEKQEAERVELQFIQNKKQRDLRKLKKVRKQFLKVQKEWLKYQKPQHSKGIWPIEYGWDIGSEWMQYSLPDFRNP